MVYVQYNLKLRQNQLLNKTPKSSNITLDDFDPSSEWVVETLEPTFDNEDLSWMDLDQLPAPPSGSGEWSQNPTIDPHFAIANSEDEDEGEAEDVHSD